MTLPEVVVTTRAQAPPRGMPTSTGTAFIVAESDRGPDDYAVQVRSLADYNRWFGGRRGDSYAYDWLDTFFREGGTRAWVARAVGADATRASLEFDDAEATPTIRVEAEGPGASYHDLAVAVVAGPTDSTFVIVVTDDGVTVDRSPALSSPAEAVMWGAEQSPYLRVIDLGVGTNPEPVAAASLAGGDEDVDGIDDDQRIAALELFTRELGAGTVAVPGRTSADVHAGIAAHIAANPMRFGVLDPPNVGTAATIAATTTPIRALGVGAQRTFGIDRWLRVPGLVPGTTRLVPPSAGVAGLFARNDATHSANVPAAGVNGELRYAIGFAQPEWSDEDRELLYDAGINTWKNVYGGLRLYGYRTMVDPAGVDAAWLPANNARFATEIAARADFIGEQFMFAEVDGNGHKLSEYEGALAGMLTEYWTAGSLYGETADEAFAVHVSLDSEDGVSFTLRAVLSVKMSPFAERVEIEIVKIMVTEAL